MSHYKNNKLQAQENSPKRYEVEDAYTVDLYRSSMNAMGPAAPGSSLAAAVIAERRSSNDRRYGALRAFLYGNFRPRRRKHRRATDGHLFLFDWYEPRVLFLALGVLLLSCADALFTLNLLPLGATEGNLVMATMLDQGMAGFLVSKISLTSISLVVLVALVRRKFYRSFSVEHLLITLFIGYVLLIGYEIYLFKFIFRFNIF